MYIHYNLETWTQDDHLRELPIFEICIEHGQILDVTHTSGIARNALVTDLCYVRPKYDDNVTKGLCLRK